MYIIQNRTLTIHFVCVKPMYPKLPKSLHNILINEIKNNKIETPDVHVSGHRYVEEFCNIILVYKFII